MPNLAISAFVEALVTLADQAAFRAAIGAAGNAFARVQVTGQPDVDADSTSDTLTLVQGGGITITTNSSGDTITISATGTSVTIVTDPALPGDNTVVPGVQAVRTAIANAVTGLLDLKTDLDCSTNPNYPVGLKGDAYVVTVAGRVGGGSGAQVEVGDFVVCKADNAGGNQAAVGTSWFILERNVVGLLIGANNLSDLTNPAAARTNLGLASARTRTIVFNFDGGSSAPATGLTGEFSAPVAGTITRAKLLLDAAGSAVVDIRKGTFAGGAPSASICASAKPTLSSSRRAIVPLTGWTLAFNADDMFVANLESASGFTKGVLVIEYEAN